MKRLRDAGAIILGTTIMTEGGVTPWLECPLSRPYNVYNFDRYCGGSSSGSAVAVAGLVPAAIGFDGEVGKNTCFYERNSWTCHNFWTPAFF